MEWIRAGWRILLAMLFLSPLLLHSSHAFPANLECPTALSTGQPACNVSRDAGSNTPDSTLSEHVGNPIDVVSGNKYQSEVDVQLGNSHLSLVRHYNSASADQNLGLGNGWRHTYSVVLTTSGEDIRQIMQSDGRLIIFSKQGDDYLAADESDGYVTETSANRHIWQLPDGRRLAFFGSFLTSISFAEGGSLNLYYRGSRLYSVSDEQGRSLVFHYTPGSVGLPAYEPAPGSSAPGHLHKVVIPDGSEIKFAYSRNQNLVSVDYPRGDQGNTGRRYRYQDSLNAALLTERGDANGRVFARWRYDEMGRAISYRSSGSIRADGSEVGAANVALEYLAGPTSGTGITRVSYRKGLVREYEWKLNERGQVIELRREVADSSDMAATDPSRQPVTQSDSSAYIQYYPHDVLTVLSIDSLGYPSSVQHTLERDGSSHILDTFYDQTGRLVEVNWKNGVLEDFNSGQKTTIAELERFVEEQRVARTRMEEVFSALSQKAFIQGTVTEFLEETGTKLAVGATATGEQLDEARRSVSLYDDENSGQRRYKIDGETEGDGEAPCIDPLQDCESLLRTRDYAEVAECAYVEVLCHTRFVEVDLGSLGIGLADVHERSFHAEIFYDREQDEYLVSFAGTDMLSGGDWWNNIGQEFGFSAFQYEKAVQLARLLVSESPERNFSFVGHSLGGGLATAAAASVGRDATVFNPAALDQESAAGLGINYGYAQSNTQIYSVEGEILNDVQTGLEFSNTPPGTVHSLRRPNYDWIQADMGNNPYTFYPTRLGVALHGMAAVRQSLAELIERNNCV